jgi:hypothetical protein
MAPTSQTLVVLDAEECAPACGCVACSLMVPTRATVPRGAAAVNPTLREGVASVPASVVAGLRRYDRLALDVAARTRPATFTANLAREQAP